MDMVAVTIAYINLVKNIQNTILSLRYQHHNFFYTGNQLSEVIRITDVGRVS